jgi:hypothetical protein
LSLRGLTKVPFSKMNKGTLLNTFALIPYNMTFFPKTEMDT